MSKNIENKLKNVNIGGNYTGGDSTNNPPPSDSQKQKWLIPILVALIGAVGVIIAAFIKSGS